MSLTILLCFLNFYQVTYKVYDHNLRGHFTWANVLRNKVWLYLYTEYLGNVITVILLFSYIFLHFLYLIIYFMVFWGGCPTLWVWGPEDSSPSTLWIPERWQASLSTKPSHLLSNSFCKQKSAASFKLSSYLNYGIDSICTCIHTHTNKIVSLIL